MLKLKFWRREIQLMERAYALGPTVSMAAENIRWLSRELEKLGVDEDTNRYILSIDDINDQKEYIADLIESESKRKYFLLDWQARFGNDNFQVYQKQRFNDDQKKKPHEKSKPLPALNQSSNSVVSQNGSASNHGIEIGIGAKKKTKFVSLYSQEGQAKSVIQLPGRYICECQAAKHKLVNNCIECGRVVCEQEGAGPCVFCDSLVCTPEDQEIIDRGSKKGEKLRQRLLKAGSHFKENDSSQFSSKPLKHQEGFVKALEHRDKLLEFDKHSVRRTQVIDDECDYFASDGNQWLSEEEKNKLRKKEDMLRQARHGSRRDRKITFDFAGRRVLDADEDAAKNMYDLQNSVVQEVHYGSSGNGNTSKEEFVNMAQDITRPIFDESSVQWGPSKQQNGKSTSTASSNRIQDRELQEMSDQGLCLSMHQPWATLLVAGIKKDEGRTWYTAHRGRLWIASTAKPPATEEIKEMENIYSNIYRGHTLKFPTSYPTGSLLGCVNVEDCLSQEDYREQFPDGESNSPFVFICSNPQELIVKFPIKGKHKMYKLDQNVHQAAKKGLR